MPFDSFQKLKDEKRKERAHDPVDSAPMPTNHCVLIDGGSLWIRHIGERSDGQKRIQVYAAVEFGK